MHGGNFCNFFKIEININAIGNVVIEHFNNWNFFLLKLTIDVC